MKFDAFIVYLLLSVFSADAVKKTLSKEINICKRYDPQLQKCYCDNFKKLIPVLKNGAPEMNMVPIDPVEVEHIRMELPQMKSVYFQADLNNVTLHGLSRGRTAQCEAHMTDDGIQLAFELVFPEIEMKSKYIGDGKFLLLGIHGNGEFHGKFSGMDVKSVWNTTRYMKNGKEHLKFTARIEDLKMEKIEVHFTNIFGNNAELNEGVNDILNANVDLLYDEIKPIVLETIKKLSLKIINDFYEAFPFDVLYPKN